MKFKFYIITTFIVWYLPITRKWDWFKTPNIISLIEFSIAVFLILTQQTFTCSK